jgi:hypothetical protein
MQVHLVDLASSKPLVQRLGRRRLELCMMGVEELRKTYFGAEIVFRMFSNAVKQIDKRTDFAVQSSSQQQRTQSSSFAHLPENGLRPDSANSSHGNDVVPTDLMSMMWNPFSQISQERSLLGEYVSNFQDPKDTQA